MARVTSEAVKAKAKELGADIAGVASADRFADAPEGFRPADILPGARSVISVGIRQLRSYMERAPDTLYFMFAYRQKNDYINQICWSLARLLDSEGYYALPIQGSLEGELMVSTRAEPGRAERKRRPNPKMRGSFSHAHAAVNAGLGEIGLNGLFLNPVYGPRVFLGSVITTAPLSPDPLLKTLLCDRDGCKLCVEQCPAHAIGTGGEVNHIDCLIALDKLHTGYEETIKQMLDQQQQTEPLLRAALSVGYSDFKGIGFCGTLCVNACPVGRKKLH